MPELPEVETVKNTLKAKILGRTIKDVNILYNIIEGITLEEFKQKLIDNKIIDIKRRGKWLMFELNDYFLLSHLRMEGKYFLDGRVTKHDLVVFNLDSGILKYNDTRKFGRMYLIEKDKVYNTKPLVDLGLEPWDKKLDINYLKDKYKNKKLPIKTLLLDQSIITGIGNIYANEILFKSNINPLKRGSKLSNEELNKIIINTRDILKEAIKCGGTTIKSYESSKGVHGRFQSNLLVHSKEGKNCKVCNNLIIKIKVNGRGTYYCPSCQKDYE